MSTAQTFADTLLAPGRALAGAAARRSFLPPLLVATVASLLLASAVAPRFDYERAVDQQIEKNPQAAQKMSPHDREVALAQAQKLGAFLTYAAALLWPTLRALAVAICAFVAFRVAGARASFAGLLAVASWGLLPLAVKDLASLPALLRMHGITAQDAERALPSSLAALLPPDAHAPLAELAWGLDLFSVWSVGLVALGAAQVSGASRQRSLAVILVLWGSYVLLTRVALPGLMGGSA
jgi:hypothetical protein